METEHHSVCEMSPSKSVMLLLIMCAVSYVLAESAEKSSSLIDKIKSGVELAGKILGSDITSKVAQLVATAFKAQRKQDQNKNDESSGFLTRIFKFLTMDASKIGAVVMNAFIFLAQLIQTSVTKRPALPEADTPRQTPDGTPYEWITENESPELQSMLAMAKDDNLTDKIIDLVKEQSKGDTGCVQLLICKIDPFIKGMQRALKDREEGRTESSEPGLQLSILYKYLPDLDDFKRHSETCSSQECALH